MKALDGQSDKNLGKRTADAGITTAAAGLDVVAGGIPAFSGTWLLCKALIGNAMALREQRVLELIKMVVDNPTKFREEIVSSTEFQDAFVVALEDYMKIRTVLKRSIAQKIFMGYATARDKEHFKLERYNMTLRQISADGLNFMGYLKMVIEPKREERVAKTMDGIDLDQLSMPVTQARMYVENQNPLSSAYEDMHLHNESQVWLPNKPNPNYPGGHSSMAVTVKDADYAVHEGCLAELVSLGILTRTRYTTPTSSFDPQTIHHDFWDYTDYGRDFAAFVEQAR